MKKEEYIKLIDKIVFAETPELRTKHINFLWGEINPTKEKKEPPKDTFKEDVINSFKIIFETYPELNALPVYAWGRYYKYECAGEPFEHDPEEGFDSFQGMINSDEISFDWDLLERINDEIWDKVFEFYYFDRKKCAKKYKFDSRGGKCLVILKYIDTYDLFAIDCDSPE